MKMILAILMLPLIINCNTQKTGIIQIKNDSHRLIDSIQLRINNYMFTVKSVSPQSLNNYNFSKDFVNAKHDVWYGCKGFIADSVVFDEWLPSNDMGYIPGIFKVQITDSLRLAQY